MENLYSITQVFSEKLFFVPDYQRGYAWETQQCQEFTEDLELLEPNRTHFLGTLILHLRSENRVIDRNGTSYLAYDIVDGQQRLTTVVILLKVISGFLQKQEEAKDLVDNLQQQYLVSRDRNKRPLPKLTLNEDSQTYFNQVILGQGSHIGGATIRSHERLLQAKTYFTNYLEERQAALGAAFGEWLVSLYFKLIQDLTLMVYIVKREADAGIIFETMNNRGKPITELEKVKNYLLYLAGKLHLPAEHTLVESINQTWKHIFESLMGAGLGSQDNEDQLLRAHWLMAYDPQPANWLGSRSIKTRFSLKQYEQQHELLLEHLHHYLNTLFDVATAYCDILRPNRPGAFHNFQGRAVQRQISKEAAKLARLGSLASFLPLLMALRIQYPEDGGSYGAMVQLCEKYAFRVYRWLRLRSNAGQTRLFRLGHQVFLRQISLENVKNRLAQLILNYAPDSQFAAAFDEEDANWYHWAGLKYFLYEYESHLADQKGVPVKMPYEEIARKTDSVEHILPQTADRQRYWQQRFPRKEYTRWLHDVGNLTLTYTNTELGNRPFLGQGKVKGKRDFYEESVFLMERELAKLEDWNLAALNSRREQIKTWALARWHVDKPDMPAEDEPDLDGLANGDIKEVFTRRAVPRGQQQLFTALYDAGEGGLTNDELVQIMGRRDRQDLVGVLGALGRRVNNTEGYGRATKPGIGMLLFIEPDSGNQWRYSLRPETRAALEELNPSWLQEMVA